MLVIIPLAISLLFPFTWKWIRDIIWHECPMTLPPTVTIVRTIRAAPTPWKPAVTSICQNVFSPEYLIRNGLSPQKALSNWDMVKRLHSDILARYPNIGLYTVVLVYFLLLVVATCAERVHRRTKNTSSSTQTDFSSDDATVLSVMLGGEVSLPVTTVHSSLEQSTLLEEKAACSSTQSILWRVIALKYKSVIASLKEQLKVCDSDMAKTQSELSNFQHKLNSCELEMEKLQIELKMKTEHQAHANQSLSEQQSIEIELKSQIDEMQKLHHLAIIEFESKLKQQNEDQANSDAMRSEKEALLVAKDNEILEKNAHLKQTYEALELVQEQEMKLKEKLRLSEKQVTNSESRVKAMSNKYKELTAEFTKQKVEYKELEDMLETACKKETDLSKQVKGANLRVAEIEKQLNASEQKVAEKDQAIKQANIARLQANNSVIDAERKASQQQQIWNNEKRSLQAEVDNKSTEILKLRDEVEAHQAQLKSGVSDTKAESSEQALVEENRKLQADLKYSHSHARDLIKIKERLEARLAEATVDTSSQILKQQVQNLTTEKTDLQKHVLEQNVEKFGLEKRIERLESELRVALGTQTEEQKQQVTAQKSEPTIALLPPVRVVLPDQSASAEQIVTTTEDGEVGQIDTSEEVNNRENNQASTVPESTPHAMIHAMDNATVPLAKNINQQTEIKSQAFVPQKKIDAQIAASRWANIENQKAEVSSRSSAPAEQVDLEPAAFQWASAPEDRLKKVPAKHHGAKNQGHSPVAHNTPPSTSKNHNTRDTPQSVFGQTKTALTAQGKKGAKQITDSELDHESRMMNYECGIERLYL